MEPPEIPSRTRRPLPGTYGLRGARRHGGCSARRAFRRRAAGRFRRIFRALTESTVLGPSPRSDAERSPQVREAPCPVTMCRPWGMHANGWQGRLRRHLRHLPGGRAAAHLDAPLALAGFAGPISAAGLLGRQLFASSPERPCARSGRLGGGGAPRRLTRRERPRPPACELTALAPSRPRKAKGHSAPPRTRGRRTSRGSEPALGLQPPLGAFLTRHKHDVLPSNFKQLSCVISPFRAGAAT